VVAEYLATVSATDPSIPLVKRHVGVDVRIDGVELLVDGKPCDSVQAGQPCIFRVHYCVLAKRPIQTLSCSIMLFSEGQKLVNLWTNCKKDFSSFSKALTGNGFIDCRINKWPFRNRTIRLDVFSHTGPVTQDWIEEVLVFNSHDGDFYESGVITNADQGIMFLDQDWSFGHADE
jgi:hypothetical protein